MIKLFKQLFKKEKPKSDYEKRLERAQEEKDRLKEIYTSDLYQYEYETDKQKVLKQIYPNKSNVEILLGFYKPQKDGYRIDKSEIDKYVPDHCAYKLDNTFITSTDINKVYSQLGAVVVKLKDDFIQEEVLNRFVRRHHEALEKTSPTILDKFGDNLHDGLLVVEQDTEQNISKEVFEHSWSTIISRITIVETPWVQTVLNGDGSITTNRGTDKRLHVYLQAENPEQGVWSFEDQLNRENRKQRLNNFLTD